MNASSFLLKVYANKPAFGGRKNKANLKPEDGRRKTEDRRQKTGCSPRPFVHGRAENSHWGHLLIDWMKRVYYYGIW
jgi:hypothetical protein